MQRSIKIHVFFSAYACVRARIRYNIAYTVLRVNGLKRLLRIRVNAMKTVVIFIRIRRKHNRVNVVLIYCY